MIKTKITIIKKKTKIQTSNKKNKKTTTSIRHKYAPNRHVTNLAIASQTKKTNIQEIKPTRTPSNNKNIP